MVVELSVRKQKLLKDLQAVTIMGIKEAYGEQVISWIINRLLAERLTIEEVLPTLSKLS
jgi:hypothetical protein